MEPITFTLILEPLLKLLEGISNLEKTKFQDKQTLFNEIVKPLFEELEPVASNYVDFFRKTREAINTNPRRNVPKILQNLQKDREVMYMARIKVRRMADQIKESVKDDEIIKFADAVGAFFNYRGVEAFASTLGSASRDLLSMVDDYATRQNSGKKFMSSYIDNILKELEKSWEDIVRSYAILKIYSVSSPNLVHKRQIKKSKSQ